MSNALLPEAPGAPSTGSGVLGSPLQHQDVASLPWVRGQRQPEAPRWHQLGQRRFCRTGLWEAQPGGDGESL